MLRLAQAPFNFDTTCVEDVSATSVHVGQKLDVDGFENSAQLGQNSGNSQKLTSVQVEQKLKGLVLIPSTSPEVGVFDYSSMTSNIILAPSLKLFWKIRQSVMV